MITGIIHKGSGLGDQLFSYILTRVIALDKGYDFGFIGKEFFKGASFMDLDWGKDTAGHRYEVVEASGEVYSKSWRCAYFRANKLYYDPEANFVEDGTVIDGYGAQDQRYFQHRMGEIAGWLKTKPLEVDDNVCIVNFRGGEFAAIPELFLPQKYWDDAVLEVHNVHDVSVFGVHTDDPDLAAKVFPDFVITKDIGHNWNSVRNARHAIIANSAFGIIPRLLKHHEDPTAVTIAPRYWARRNEGRWHNPSNYYDAFQYI